MGMPQSLYYTADMVRAFPEDRNKYEVVHGELLVTPAPRAWHEVIVLRLSERLSAYVREDGIAYVFGSRSDISWAPDTMVQPDVFAVPIEDARTLDWVRMKRLLLVVEVLSPSSRRADRFTKRLEYQRQGIPLYWLVDPDERRVEIWRPGDTFPAFELDSLIWHPAGARAPFVLPLAELFATL